MRYRTAPETQGGERTAPLEGLLTDVDGTLTLSGQLRASTYALLWSLHQRGCLIIPVTGRSSGWAQVMLAMWPVDAVVAENGAVVLWRESESGRTVLAGEAAGGAWRLRCQTFGDPTARPGLLALARLLLADYPPLALAYDQAQREVDVAIDWNEQVRAPKEVAEQCVEALRKAGFSAQRSSVHINAWAGCFDKASSSLWLLEHCFGVARQRALERWFFVGDAPNDESMFATFPRHLAVQPLESFRGAVQYLPQRFSGMRESAGFNAWAQEVLDDWARG
jgi:hydroxymethylpyrimidine pyrophosphatase-like HAD family hydrolase